MMRSGQVHGKQLNNVNKEDEQKKQKERNSGETVEQLSIVTIDLTNEDEHEGIELSSSLQYLQSVKLKNRVGAFQYLSVMMKRAVWASLTSTSVLHDQVKGLVCLNHLKQLDCNTEEEILAWRHTHSVHHNKHTRDSSPL